MGKYKNLGIRQVFVDAKEKVTGAAKYLDDMEFPRLLIGKILRSPHPHARIVRIDTSEAEALPGVKAVITAKDPPGCKFGNAFTRIAAREAMALPVINAAVQLTVENGRISAAHIVTAPVAVTPFRARKAEECLIGKLPGSIGDLKRAAKITEQEAKPRDSLVRRSGGYRKALVKDLVEKALLRTAGSLG